MRKEMEGVADAVSAGPKVHESRGTTIYAIGQDGTLWAKGANDYGQLGDGRMVFVPTLISK